MAGGAGVAFEFTGPTKTKEQTIESVCRETDGRLGIRDGLSPV
jgi:hypothetical protein